MIDLLNSLAVQAILLLSLSLCPIKERIHLHLLRSYELILLYSKVGTDSSLVGILTTCVLRGVHDPDLFVSEHILKHHLLTDLTHTNADVIINGLPFLDL